MRDAAIRLRIDAERSNSLLINLGADVLRAERSKLKLAQAQGHLGSRLRSAPCARAAVRATH